MTNEELREFIKSAWKRQTLEERAEALEAHDALAAEAGEWRRKFGRAAYELNEAAAEVERLRETLKEIASVSYAGSRSDSETIALYRRWARAALDTSNSHSRDET